MMLTPQNLAHIASFLGYLVLLMPNWPKSPNLSWPVLFASRQPRRRTVWPDQGYMSSLLTERQVSEFRYIQRLQSG